MDSLVAILGRWENVLFLVPATVGLLFVLLQFVGLGSDALHHGHDVDHDLGHDHDVGHDHDAGHDHDHDHDHAHDAPHGVEHGPGFFAAVLTWFNIGRAPFMVVAQCMLLSFGLYGVLGTTVLARAPQHMGGWPAIGLAAAFAFVAASVTTKLISGAFARWLPTFETKRTTSRSLVGSEAEVASEVVDEQGGRAAARDAQGDLYTVFCRTAPGAPPAKRGEKVQLVAYHAEQDRYTVKPLARPVTGGTA